MTRQRRPAYAHARVVAICALLSFIIPACGTDQGSGNVVWRGHVLKEVRALEKLPAGIRSNLGADRSGLEGVADRGRPFNVTDVVNDKLPMRRLLTAGQDGATWLVALEHGGRGYNVEVFLFSAPDSTPVQKWVLLKAPGNLREVVQELPQ